jgi:heat shock protein HslJ
MRSNTTDRARWTVVTVVLALSGGCQPAETQTAVNAEGPPVAAIIADLPAQAAPNPQELANATYYGIAEHPVTLSNGVWQGEPYTEGAASRPRVGLADGFAISGDINSDRIDEAIVLLWSNTGGSGTFDYLAVVGRDDTGAVYNLATAPLGDRVQLVSATLKRNILAVDVVQAGPDDAACCPGQKMRRMFALNADSLVELSATDRGRQSTADLAGIEWMLTELYPSETVPTGIPVTLNIDGDRISGTSGCNRYSGGISEGKIPGAMTVNMNMALTMMACPSPEAKIEHAYLGKLQAVTGYSFQAGKLVLSWQNDPTGQSGQLKFNRHY